MTNLRRTTIPYSLYDMEVHHRYFEYHIIHSHAVSSDSLNGAPTHSENARSSVTDIMNTFHLRYSTSKSSISPSFQLSIQCPGVLPLRLAPSGHCVELRQLGEMELLKKNQGPQNGRSACGRPYIWDECCQDNEHSFKCAMQWFFQCRWLSDGTSLVSAHRTLPDRSWKIRSNKCVWCLLLATLLSYVWRFSGGGQCTNPQACLFIVLQTYKLSALRSLHAIILSRMHNIGTCNYKHCCLLLYFIDIVRIAICPLFD